MMLLARTTPLDEVKRKTDGLSLFFTDLDRTKIEVREIHKMGRHAVDSNMLFISDLWIPEEDRIGAEGDGFKIILHGLNPERILLGAEAIGLGRVAIKRAARYASGAHRLRPPDRHEPGHPAPAGQVLGPARSGQPDGA